MKRESPRPWPALWALVVGFFMIMIDATIVSVANPKIMESLNTDITTVIWVTSAYLLAYAVPLLVTGRMGDRFGPKNVYLAGLVVFTLSSLWCGLSGSIEMLIIARVFQGLGAALMSPQTMTVITRMFPPDRRGTAMGIWGTVAGVATLVGPVLGGVLVDSLGWQWIFFVNLPVGVVAVVLALLFVPTLPTHAHRFDILGVVLSGLGMFLLVFGIQEGQTYDWGTIAGPISVWSLIAAGLVVLALFVWWQHLNRAEPLMPLRLFRVRNFSLANAAITTVAFAVTSLPMPLIFYFQLVRGMSPTQSALMMVPMAVLGAALAPMAGALADRIPPRIVAGTGLLSLVAGLVWYLFLLTPDSSILALLGPSVLLGIASATMWSPISATVTRHLTARDAGAGSGVYNATRQVGAVMGSASIAALMTGLLAVFLPGGGASALDTGVLPPAAHAGFSAAMGWSLLLPAAVGLAGLVVVAFFADPQRGQTPDAAADTGTSPSARSRRVPTTTASIAVPVTGELVVPDPDDDRDGDEPSDADNASDADAAPADAGAAAADEREDSRTRPHR